MNKQKITKLHLNHAHQPTHPEKSMEEVVEGVTEQLSSVFEAGKVSGLGEDDISQTIDLFYKEFSRKEKASMPLLQIVKLSVLKAAYFLLYRLLPLALLLSSLYSQLQLVIQKDPCLLAQPMLHDFAAKIIDCNSCMNIKNAVTIDSISVMDFMNNHATSLQPVLMKGAASNWPATSIFSYEYFKGLYMKNPEAITHDREEGQFFPYSSGIFTLDEFLSLDNKTASLKGKKWYIGWLVYNSMTILCHFSPLLGVQLIILLGRSYVSMLKSHTSYPLYQVKIIWRGYLWEHLVLGQDCT